jgi:hypothetical protein
VRATHGGACFARTQRRRRSPGGRRLELGDDRGVPQVSGTGRGSAGRRQLGPEGQLGRVRRWAIARVEAAGRAGERGCWASWLLRAAAA